MQREPLERLARLIHDLKQIADAIEEDGEEFPAVNRNIRRVQASIKMLELNVSDISEL